MRALILAAAALLLASRASAADNMILPNPFGCVPCSSCIFPSCWRSCRPSCGGWFPQPSNVVVSGDSCRASGNAYGPPAAAQACASAQAACSALGARRPLGAVGPTTLSQCSNIVLGSCQQAASPWGTECAAYWASGYGNCGADDFQAAFNSAAASACTSYAQTVTDVTPGTNSWVVPPFVPQPYIVIGSSGPGAAGGAIGAAAPAHGGGGGAGNPVGMAALGAKAPAGGRRMLHL